MAILLIVTPTVKSENRNVIQAKKLQNSNFCRDYSFFLTFDREKNKDKLEKHPITC
jgi:hypothetical protein